MASRARRTLVGLTVGACMLLLAPGADASLSFVSAIGGPGTGEGQFERPDGVAVDPSTGDIYVSDPSIGRVQKFDPSGKFLAQAGTKGNGSEEGEFHEPVGPGEMAVDPASHNVWVVDPDNQRVQELSPSAEYLSSISLPEGKGLETFNMPSGVAVDPVDDSLYVTNAGNDRVERFDASGKFVSEVGDGEGTGYGQLSKPLGVAVDPLSEDVYVVDSGNNRVQKFDPSGKFLFQFPCSGGICPVGSNIGALDFPAGVAVDPHSGDVYVAEAGGWLAQFNSSGEPLAQAVPPGGLVGFAGEGGVAISPTGEQIYMADAESRRVDLFTTAPVSNTGAGEEERPPALPRPIEEEPTTEGFEESATNPLSLALSGAPRFKAGAVTYRLSCTGPPAGSCHATGTLTLIELVKAPGSHVVAVSRFTKKRRTVTVGSKATVIEAGQSAAVTVALNTAGHKLLAQFGRLHLTITVSSAGSKHALVTKTLSVTAPKRLKRRRAKK